MMMRGSMCFYRVQRLIHGGVVVEDARDANSRLACGKFISIRDDFPFTHSIKAASYSTGCTPGRDSAPHNNIIVYLFSGNSPLFLSLLVGAHHQQRYIVQGVTARKAH